MPGLKRDEAVFLNRVLKEYTQDRIPNEEQVRHDIGRLCNTISRIAMEIDKMLKEDR